jgi:hypothetical protein
MSAGTFFIERSQNVKVREFCDAWTANCRAILNCAIFYFKTGSINVWFYLSIRAYIKTITTKKSGE